jgi:hypothetical protein
MKMLQIWALGIGFCALGMAIPVSAGTTRETVKGGVKVSHPGGGKGDHLFFSEAISL